MTARASLSPLVRISQLRLDQELAKLEKAAAAVAATRAHIADLEMAPAPPDLSPIVAAQAGLRFQRWADARRADLNLTLARQTLAWIEAREAARIAFGRADALRKLQSGR